MFAPKLLGWRARCRFTSFSTTRYCETIVPTMKADLPLLAFEAAVMSKSIRGNCREKSIRRWRSNGPKSASKGAFRGGESRISPTLSATVY